MKLLQANHRPASYVVIVFLLLSIASINAYSQCSTDNMYVYGTGACGNYQSLVVNEFTVSATHYTWYRKINGVWSWEAETYPDMYGSSTYLAYVTGPTVFGVSYYNESAWCESSVIEISVSPTNPPSISASGYSCQPGTAYVEAAGSNVSMYYLAKYVGGTYQSVDANSTGDFTINEFYEGEQYYIMGSSGSCSGNYQAVPIYVSHASSPTVTGTTSVCYGGATVLTASGGAEGAYKWYKGSEIIPGATGSQLNTGPITTASTHYYVSYLVEVGIGQCESPMRAVTITMTNPIAPTPNSTGRCGPGDVLLSASSGFDEYSWYNQSGVHIGSTTSFSTTASSEGLTSYTVRVRKNNCWSTMSASAPVSITHSQIPYVTQAPACGPNSNVTMYASYYGERSGNYYVEWYTSPTSTEPEHSVLLNQAEETAGYTIYLPSDKDYWIGIYDPATSVYCRTERAYFRAQVGSTPYVWADGYSCDPSSAVVSAGGSNEVTQYYLYRLEDQGTGPMYYELQNNSSGSFNIYDPELVDAQFETYYVRGKSANGCWSAYVNVEIELVRPISPSVTGDLTVCHNSTTILTASGGAIGKYRWYKGTSTNLLPGERSSQLTTEQLTIDVRYFVSHIVESYNGGECESPKAWVDIDILPLSSVSGFAVSPSTEFYGTSTPELGLSYGTSVGTVTYESSTNGSSWTATASPVSVDQTTQFRAKSVFEDCTPAYSDPVTVTLYPFPKITSEGNVTSLSYGNTVRLSTGQYHSYQWFKDGNNIVGAKGQNIDASEPGEYTVTVTGSSTAAEATSEGFIVYDNPLKGQNENYISTITYLREGMDPTAVYRNRPEYYTQLTTYFDGLGRAKQTVVTKGSPQRFDVVQPVTYDEFGRESFKYLPYVSDQSDGWYKNDAIPKPENSSEDPLMKYRSGKQFDFYQSGADVPSDLFPYAESVFEPSPLNRLKEQGAQGQVWQPAAGTTIKHFYGTNVGGEVRIWTYSLPNDDHPLGLVESVEDYPGNRLFKKITTDEHGRDMIEYKDKEGKLILKRVQAVEDFALNVAPAVNDTNYASTYYVYDDAGSLVYVIQPEGVENIAEYLNADPGGREAFLQKWAFRYRYDERKRMIFKQVPGADSVVMVYDDRDRLVLTQDGNQRTKNQWSYTKYDQFNRPITSGIYSHGSKVFRKYMADQLSETAISETYNGSTSNFGYSNDAFPKTNFDVLTVTYYDNYDFKSLLSNANGDFDFKSDEVPADGLSKGQDQFYFERVKNQVTGTLTKVLNTSTRLSSINYYDDHYRVIQSTSSSLQGGFTRVTNVYNFVGKVLRTKTRYILPGHSQYPDIEIFQRFSYDPAGRLLKTLHKIATHPEVVLSSNEYNELGELITKKLHQTISNGAPVTADPLAEAPESSYETDILATRYSDSKKTYIASKSIRLLPGFAVTSGNTFLARIGYSSEDALAYNDALAGEYLQTIDYRYNIRGWLALINNPSDPVADDLFNMELRYYDPTANGGEPQYNGNISEAIWKSAGLDKQSYGYEYDAMNRILDASYFNIAKPKENGWYDESVGDPTASPPRPAYDLNGNILNLLRKTKNPDPNGINGLLMDDLRYDYIGSGNRLNYVSDDRPFDADEEGFKELAAGENATDYEYDKNGNLVKDENKGIISDGTTDGIEYNHLNLPEKVSKSATEYVDYIYDAAGRKMAQEVFATTGKRTDYLGELVFEGDNLQSLQYILHSEGRIVVDTNPNASDPWEYQYFLKDHLGNTRVVFSEKNHTKEYKGTIEDDPPGDNSKAEEMNDFFNYPGESTGSGVRSALPEFDHTDAGSVYTYSQKLTGGYTARVGLAKSFEVSPGDVFDLEVYAKYEAPTEIASNRNTLLTQLASAFSLGSNATPLDGAAAQSAFEDTFIGGLPWIDGTMWDDNAPKAYLNYILFDENFVLVDAGFDQLGIDGEGEEDFVGPPVPHDYLSLHLKVQQKGYLYVYLSNEQPVETNVYFDDMKIVHYNAVEQVSDYYPFGLTFNSYQRENSVDQKYKFQGQEHIDDLGLDWDSFKWRNHQPDIGRFFNSDPLAHGYVFNSPYAFCENQVTTFYELEGLEKGGRASSSRNMSRRSGGNIAAIRRAIADAAEIANRPRGFATFGRGGSMERRIKYSFDRGTGYTARPSNSYGRDPNAGDVSNFDNTHGFGNFSGNGLKVLGEIAEITRNILAGATSVTVVHSLTEVDGNMFGLGSDIIINDMSTTFQLAQLQTAYTNEVFKLAKGDLSDEEWEGLSEKDRELRLIRATADSGPSPLDNARNMVEQAEKSGEGESTVTISPSFNQN